MVEFNVNCGKINLTIQAYPDNIRIIDSYKINSKKEMKKVIIEVLEKAPLYRTKRSIKSFVREWKCHNRFYNHNILKFRTKDCDFEGRQALYKKIFYLILGGF